MGTFGGHALPGSFFILFASWYAYNILRSFYRRRAYELHLTDKEEPVYISRCAYPVKSICCPEKKFPLDSVLKTAACLIGITGEVITGFKGKEFVHIGNAQHSTMFSTFGLSGIVEVLIFYGILRTSRNVEYIFSFVALLSEAILFGFHLHGRTPLDIYVHMLLFGMVILSIVGGLGEVIQMNQPIFALIRCWGLLMQGTWFWQVGAILYPKTSWMPIWDEMAKESLPRAANLFCYHILITFMSMVMMASIMSMRLGRITNTTTATRNRGYVESQARASDGLVESVELDDQLTLYAAPSVN